MTKLEISVSLLDLESGSSSMFRFSSIRCEVGLKVRGINMSRSLTRRSMDLAVPQFEPGKTAQQTDYSNWSNDSLIERVTQLEQQLKE